MATFSLGETVLGTKVDLDGLNKGLKKAETKSKTSVAAIGKTFASIGKIAVAGIAAATIAVGGLSAGLTKLAVDAVPLAGIKDGFDSITAASGKASDAVLRDFRIASKGMVSNADLMLSFNEATQLVSEEFAFRLPESFEALNKVAAATGKDVGRLVNDLVVGIGRGSKQILDNLGIIVDIPLAEEAFAASVGKTVEELSKQERQIALTNQVFAALEENTANLPDGFATVGTLSAQLQTSLQNLRDEAGLALTPALSSVLGALNTIVTTIGPKVIPIIEQLTPTIQTLASSFGSFFDLMNEGASFTQAMQKTLSDLIPAETLIKLGNIVLLGQQFIETLKPLGEELKNVFVELGLVDEESSFLDATIVFVTKSLVTLTDIIEGLTIWLDDLQFLIQEVKAGWDGFGLAIDTIGGKLNKLELPPFLTPGSPTPFETGLRGISDALNTLNSSDLPQFALGLNATGGGGNTTINNTNFSQTVNNNNVASSAIDDYYTLRAMTRGS